MAIRYALVGWVTLAATITGETRAEEHAPPTLPNLLHVSPTVRMDHTFAYVGAASVVPTEPDSLSWVDHLDVEIPFPGARWYAGGAWEVTSTGSKAGRALVLGNPELFVRGVWSSKQGLSAGGSLGVVIPLPEQVDRTRERGVATARALRPWEGAYFTPTTLALRPAFDVRLIAGAFVFQLRQGLDLGYNFDRTRTDFLARTSLLLAVKPLDGLAFDLEAFEAYALTQDVPDNTRAAFVLAPTISGTVSRVQFGIGALFPVGTPLGGVATSFFGIRSYVSLQF